MDFTQQAPALGNQYDTDRVLHSYLKRALKVDVLSAVEPELKEMGGMAGDLWYRMQLAEYADEPRHTRFDPWGKRIDHIELTPLWQVAQRIAPRYGVVGAAYEEPYGAAARIHQFALAYLFHPSTDFYTCPLAMTDAAARALLASGNDALIKRAVPRLTARDPAEAWTSGQWMTETAGGSDVGQTETLARKDGEGQWRLYGRKWFTSAANSQMALALARPEGNGPGGSGLALFYVEPYKNGRLKDVRLLRLKDKLGTRKVPTAELQLEGCVAEPVKGLEHGVRHIAPMLNVTRVWNAIGAAATMRRGLALAVDYAKKREVFGTPLRRQALHADTLAGAHAEFEAGFHLAFFTVELLGLAETGEASEAQTRLLRLLTPIAKLTTAKQATAVSSEVLEAFGGAGYIEDTGLPVLLRDAQVFSIWEGTTNVLALDTLRALEELGDLSVYAQCFEDLLGEVHVDELTQACDTAREALAGAESWLKQAQAEGREALEAGARHFALTLGRGLALALLLRHAQWARRENHEAGPAAAARRFAAQGVNMIRAHDHADANTLIDT